MQKSVYLPNEGLQGEDIPSHILWEDSDFKSIQISFRFPLKFKEVYNSESEEVHDNHLVVRKVEWEGYLGLVFESCMTSSLVDRVPVKYSFHLSNGQVLEETKEICLFRPELKIHETPQEIKVNPVTGSTNNQIRISNAGKGTVMVLAITTKDSQLTIESPAAHSERIKKMSSDFHDEITNLGKAFPKFQPLLEELLEWMEKDLVNILREDRDEYQECVDRLSNAFASDKEFQGEFVGVYAKVLIKNIEILELMKGFIMFYKSLISKNILLINPFDEISFTDVEKEIELELLQTDRVLNSYEDIILPKIKIIGSRPGKTPLYNLFRWE